VDKIHYIWIYVRNNRQIYYDCNVPIPRVRRRYYDVYT